jgi:hypothetical protein
LKSAEGLEAIGRSRCLMLLSVLSGEKPVTDAIREARISRGTYYQLETKALRAMLVALNPMASVKEDGMPDLSAAAARIEDLQAKLTRSQQEQRRTQRLLLLTRKSMRAPVTTGLRGRLPGSIPSGKNRSPGSRVKASASAASTPTRAGETVP